MSEKLFPPDFTWGVATSAYQIEGGWNEDGKGPSIWDAFCQVPGKIARGENANIACDHYHLLETDIELLKRMGVTAYRFSLSWSRIMPTGKDKINKKGLAFYNDLIDGLITAGIEPWITLYHWDLPLAIQMEDDGWLGSKIPELFGSYARVCFEEFGDRVKNWITINEAWVVAMLGYGQGVFAPGRNSDSEPYQAGHQLLLAHANAVDIYRNHYQSRQKGRIGIANNCDWREPLTDSATDRKAAERALEFFLGWFADPVYNGRYPDSMVKRLGKRLPQFSREESELIKGSSDFFGLNHYTTLYAADSGGKTQRTGVYGNGGIAADQDVALSDDKNWSKTTMGWSVVPEGCFKLLQWISDRYDAPEIIITENGCSYSDKLVNGTVDDQERIDFYDSYLNACGKAIKEGINLTGYFAWSLMDNFEWASGYEKRFGLHYVDFNTRKRYPKRSAIWYRDFISTQKNL